MSDPMNPQPDEAGHAPAADPRELLDAMGAKWAPNLDAWINGEADSPGCALCGPGCTGVHPGFGTQAYFDLIDKAHGRSSAPSSEPGGSDV